MLWLCFICGSDRADCGHREAEIYGLMRQVREVREHLSEALLERVRLEQKLAELKAKKAVVQQSGLTP